MITFNIANDEDVTRYMNLAIGEDITKLKEIRDMLHDIDEYAARYMDANSHSEISNLFGEVSILKYKIRAILEKESTVDLSEGNNDI